MTSRPNEYAFNIMGQYNDLSKKDNDIDFSTDIHQESWYTCLLKMKVFFSPPLQVTSFIKFHK